MKTESLIKMFNLGCWVCISMTLLCLMIGISNMHHGDIFEAILMAILQSIFLTLSFIIFSILVSLKNRLYLEEIRKDIWKLKNEAR